MENEKEWYSRLPNEEELKLALDELDTKIKKLKGRLKI